MPTTLSLSTAVIVLTAFAGLAPQAFAQDSAALINALIRKGILTQDEAKEIQADVVRESHAAPVTVVPHSRSTQRLSVGMRMQIQYAYLDTDVPAAAFDPAPTNRPFLRRMYFTLKANVSETWGATMTYDFSSDGFDDAFFEWRANPDLTFNFGLRKVNVAHEERASSGNIRGLERSAVTRYFVESNNGRRLGAASYRIGAFLDGKRTLNSDMNFVYSAAITNPERNETFSLAASAGDQTTNSPALWANVGLTGKRGKSNWVAGFGVGHLPDQGGFGPAALGRGADLTLFSAYTEITAGRFNLLAEYLTADVEQGVSAVRDARPQGLVFQPGLYLLDNVEAILRFAWLDSDGRGATLADVVRSAPSGGVMNEVVEWYAGVNWYLRGNDLKYQLGLVHAKSTGAINSGVAEATTFGVRSQMQLQF